MTGLRASVRGASGISGFHAMRALLEHPERWSRIYALSRKPLPDSMANLLSESQRFRIQDVAADLLDSPKEIAETLTQAGVGADYVFFYSYMKPKSDLKHWPAVAERGRCDQGESQAAPQFPRSASAYRDPSSSCPTSDRREALRCAAWSRPRPYAGIGPSH